MKSFFTSIKLRFDDRDGSNLRWAKCTTKSNVSKVGGVAHDVITSTAGGTAFWTWWTAGTAFLGTAGGAALLRTGRTARAAFLRTAGRAA